MSKSWVALIVLALVFLVIVSGYQIFQTIGGGGERRYTLDDIEDNFGDEVLEFIDSKEGEIKIRENDI